MNIAAVVLAKSNFIAVIDPDECTACGICADERCQLDAISEDEDTYQVESELCIGCGVCTIACPTDAISLIERPESEQDIPPDNFVDWNIKRAENRGIKLEV